MQCKLPALSGCCNCQCSCAQMSRLCITQPELKRCLQWPTPEEWNSLPPANHLLPEDGPPCQLPARLSTLAPDEAFFSCYSKACTWLVGWCCCALNFRVMVKAMLQSSGGHAVLHGFVAWQCSFESQRFCVQLLSLTCYCHP